MFWLERKKLCRLAGACGVNDGLIAGNAGSHKDRAHRITLWELALPAMRPSRLA